MKRLLLPAIITSAIVAMSAQEAALTSAAPGLADVEPLMARFLADSNVVGVSVGVEHGSDVIVRGGWGLADRGTGRKATAETVYRLGSSSKQFTAALVMKLVERGVVGLDDPVDRHLPEMPRKWLGITIRQLLNHTSGVPNFTDAGSSHWAKKLSPAGLLALVSGHGLRFPAGSKYAYSNSNYVMLGQIAERHYGKPFAQILADELFGPLNMTSTRYCEDEYGANGQAMPYIRDGDRVKDAPVLEHRARFWFGRHLLDRRGRRRVDSRAARRQGGRRLVVRADDDTRGRGSAGTIRLRPDRAERGCAAGAASWRNGSRFYRDAGLASGRTVVDRHPDEHATDATHDIPVARSRANCSRQSCDHRSGSDWTAAGCGRAQTIGWHLHRQRRQPAARDQILARRQNPHEPGHRPRPYPVAASRPARVRRRVRLVGSLHIQCRKRRSDRPDVRAKRLDVHRSAEALTAMRPRVVRLTTCTLAAAVLTLGAAAGRTTIAARHAESRSATCEDALSTLLELPLVWETDLKRMILKLRDAGEVRVIEQTKSITATSRTPLVRLELIRELEAEGLL